MQETSSTTEANELLPKTYDPSTVETSVYEAWEKSGAFSPKEGNAEPFVMSLPPPNATGTLHLGHSVMLSIQDVLARYHRLRGEPTLWVPGTDHAAIATQNVVEKQIWEAEKKTRHDIGREELLKRIDAFVVGSQDTMRKQMRRMGASLDWSRERFTLDTGLSRCVSLVFKMMYDDGLIYRGNRIVNWCTRCQTTLADDEVNYKEEQVPFYHFKFGPFSIGTVRPETKLGDKYVVVHPTDERYIEYHGLKKTIPWISDDVEMTVLADEAADPTMGSGAMTITPQHSFVDFDIAGRHNLTVNENIIGLDGTLTSAAGEFAGLTVKEARKKFVEILTAKGLVEKIDEDYVHNVSVCYRCATPVEPLVSKQWFVAVNKPFKLKRNTLNYKKDSLVTLKVLCLAAVNDADPGLSVDDEFQRNVRDQILFEQFSKPEVTELRSKQAINIIPERFQKIYLNWITNLHDWCISRQIWYGHRIPVWYDITDPKNENGIFHYRSGIVFKLFDTEANTFLTWSQDALKKGESIPTWAQFGEVRIINFAMANLLNKNFGLSWTDIKADAEVKTHNLPDKSEIVTQKMYSLDSKYIQDPDTLDTWFSSGMWTFSTLLSSDGDTATLDSWRETSPDVKRFHPTTVLETGYDIIFFWVARMILMTTYALNEVPFKTVYLHGLVKDREGRKMSKSLGNGIDPIAMIEKYGADSLRLSMVVGTTPGNDFRLFEEKIAGYRNFVNKLWNISRFILTTTKATTAAPTPTTTADHWILAEFAETNRLVTTHIEAFRFSAAAEALYEFTWAKLADWYVEVAKIEGAKDAILRSILKDLLILWHPFTPFITEHLWAKLHTEPSQLISYEWPKPLEGASTEEHQNFQWLQAIITAARDLRQELGNAPGVTVYLLSSNSTLAASPLIQKMARVEVSLVTELPEAATLRRTVPTGTIAAIPSVASKTLRDEERIELERYIALLESRLEDEAFRSRAPAAIVKKEEERLHDAKERFNSLIG
ncbi:MAG: valine--tRNA ligase [Patescibacteria group bacterium]